MRSRKHRVPEAARVDRRARRRRIRDEASNSFVFFIAALPLVLASFGMGVDICRNVYIRTQLQNALDMATVAGAAVTTVNTNGNVAIAPQQAIDTVEKFYALNRANIGGLSCRGWGDQWPIPNTTLQRCWKVVGTPTVTRTYLTYTARERSQNAFLPIIGLKWQKFDVESQARVNQATQ